MKIERQAFKPEDFYGSGQYLLRYSQNRDWDYLKTVLWKVGYKSGSYFLISMTDGAIFKEHASKEELCRNLNDDERGYRQPSDYELSVLLTLIGSRRNLG